MAAGKFATCASAAAAEVIFTSGATGSINTLAFSFGEKYIKEGDEILVSQLDHEANRGPWLALREQGITVREIGITPEATLDYDDLENKLNEDTRLVAVGFSSNAIGTVNDIERIDTATPAAKLSNRRPKWGFVIGTKPGDSTVAAAAGI